MADDNGEIKMRKAATAGGTEATEVTMANRSQGWSRSYRIV